MRVTSLGIVLHGAATHHLAVFLDSQVSVVRGKDGGVRPRQVFRGVEAVQAVACTLYATSLRGCLQRSVEMQC